jgi:hypothetical protein
VFDNKSPQYAVDAVSNPLNLYGKTKLNGEEATLAAGKGNITSSFYVQENYMIQNKKKSRSWLSSSVNIKNRMAFPNGIHRLSKCDLNKFTLLCRYISMPSFLSAYQLVLNSCDKNECQDFVL